MFYEVENGILRGRKWHFALVKDVNERETRYPSLFLAEAQQFIGT